MIAILLQQLPYLVPMLLVYVGGMAVAAVYFKQHRVPSLFAFCGCALMLGSVLIPSIAQAYLIDSRNESSMEIQVFDQAIKLIAMGRMLADATGFALLLAAVFVGRKAVE